MNKIVGKLVLCQFLEKLPDSKRYIQTWYEIVKNKNLEEILTYFGPEVIVSSNLNELVFNLKIKTNYTHRYYLVVNFNEKIKLIFIKFIGTQYEYHDFIEKSKLKSTMTLQIFFQYIKLRNKKTIETEKDYLGLIKILNSKMYWKDRDLNSYIHLIEKFEAINCIILTPERLDSFKIKTKLI